MSQRNETTVFVLALLITAGLIAGGFWWFTQKSEIKLDKLNNSSLPTDSSPADSSDRNKPSPIAQQSNSSEDNF